MNQASCRALTLTRLKSSANLYGNQIVLCTLQSEGNYTLYISANLPCIASMRFLLAQLYLQHGQHRQTPPRYDCTCAQDGIKQDCSPIEEYNVLGIHLTSESHKNTVCFQTHITCHTSGKVYYVMFDGVGRDIRFGKERYSASCGLPTWPFSASNVLSDGVCVDRVKNVLQEVRKSSRRFLDIRI